MHNIPKWSDTLKNLAASAARFLMCLTILGSYALKGLNPNRVRPCFMKADTQNLEH